MIIMGNKKDKGGFVAMIRKKMNGSESYDDLKKNNEDMMEPKEESDHSMGLDSCTYEIMEAFKQNDEKKLKTALKSMIEMVINDMK